MLWMLRYRSRRKFSAWCLLFASKPCGTGVEDNAEKITPESATADHLKRKAKNKCRFLRGAGFGNLVERFFENPCRFFPPCCCKGVEGRAEYSLSLPARTTFKKYFQKISKSMSFWRLEGCGRGVGGDFARNWLRFGARFETAPGVGSVLAPKAKTKAGFSRVASILMPPSKGKSGCGIKIDAIKENFPGHP